jgi:putative transposase
VILPDHLHAIWTLPDGDADFALRWRLIQSGFRMVCPEANRSPRAAPPQQSAGSGSGDIGSTPCEDDDFARHLDYIHFNPVK